MISIKFYNLEWSLPRKRKSSNDNGGSPKADKVESILLVLVKQSNYADKQNVKPTQEKGFFSEKMYIKVAPVVFTADSVRIAHRIYSFLYWDF